MTTSFIDKIVEVLKVEEGSKVIGGKHIAYQDHLGYWTLGYGRLIDPSKIGAGISEQEAEIFLINDINNCIEECQRNFSWFHISPERVKEGLIYMCFQLGLPTLKKFKKCLLALEQENYEEAANQCLDSAWAKQTPRRADIVARLFRGE